MIQLVLEMYLDSGISELCIITSPQKPLIRDFIAGSWCPPALPFKRDAAFYDKLKNCRTVFLIQEEPRGVADAVGLARDFVKSEPFACIMPDCLLFSEKPMAKQLALAFERWQTPVIGAIFVKGDDVLRFGNVGLLEVEASSDRSFAVTSLSPKKDGPLYMDPNATMVKGFGGGVYLPEYFDLVEAIRPKAQGEVDDIPIHQILIKEGRLLAIPLEGRPFDAGHPLGFRAAVHFVGRPEGKLPKGQGRDANGGWSPTVKPVVPIT
jgi:UTP-glucose-1-phosphate uridylyltransferase